MRMMSWYGTNGDMVPSLWWYVDMVIWQYDNLICQPQVIGQNIMTTKMKCEIRYQIIRFCQHFFCALLNIQRSLKTQCLALLPSSKYFFIITIIIRVVYWEFIFVYIFVYTYFHHNCHHQSCILAIYIVHFKTCAASSKGGSSWCL